MPTNPNHNGSTCPSAGREPLTLTSHDHVRLDFEKLDCHQVALQFNALAARLIPRGHRELRDQLTRASLSTVLNIAESAGRSSRADKARFFAIARGSAMECAAIVDLLLSSGIASIGICREARQLLVRIIQMLTKLVAAGKLDAPR